MVNLYLLHIVTWVWVNSLQWCVVGMASLLSPPMQYMHICFVVSVVFLLIPASPFRQTPDYIPTHPTPHYPTPYPSYRWLPKYILGTLCYTPYHNNNYTLTHPIPAPYPTHLKWEWVGVDCQSTITHFIYPSHTAIPPSHVPPHSLTHITLPSHTSHHLHTRHPFCTALSFTAPCFSAVYRLGDI